MASPEEQHKEMLAQATTTPPPEALPQPTIPPPTQPSSQPAPSLPLDTPLPPPILTLQSCLLRPYHPSDAPQMAAAANFPLISRYMRNTFPTPYHLADATSWIALSLSRSPIRDFGIYAPDGVTFLGSIGLTPLPDNEFRTWEVGYWIKTEAWGKGLATEVVRGFSRWVFGRFGPEEVVRLEARVVEGNEGSERVLGKCGFVREGFRRGCVTTRDGERTLGMAVFGLLREDLEDGGS